MPKRKPDSERQVGLTVTVPARLKVELHNALGLVKARNPGTVVTMSSMVSKILADAVMPRPKQKEDKRDAA